MHQKSPEEDKDYYPTVQEVLALDAVALKVQKTNASSNVSADLSSNASLVVGGLCERKCYAKRLEKKAWAGAKCTWKICAACAQCYNGPHTGSDTKVEMIQYAEDDEDEEKQEESIFSAATSWFSKLTGYGVSDGAGEHAEATHPILPADRAASQRHSHKQVTKRDQYNTLLMHKPTKKEVHDPDYNETHLPADSEFLSKPDELFESLTKQIAEVKVDLEDADKDTR